MADYETIRIPSMDDMSLRAVHCPALSPQRPVQANPSRPEVPIL